MNVQANPGDWPPDMEAGFGDKGYIVVRGLFSRAECFKALASIYRNRRASPSGWYKEGAIGNPGIFYVARSDRIVDRLARLIGPDIVLWGARLIIRRPQGIHPWHSDAESAVGGGFVSVWVGLAGTTAKTSVKLIPGSHKFGKPVQQLASEHGVAREKLSDRLVADWARQFAGDSRIEQTDLANGDALIFDGRIWHGSDNRSFTRFRTALLLQYARADVPVRVPDNDHVWPWEYRGNRRPQCLLVAGAADNSTNRVLPGPAVLDRSRYQAVTTHISAVPTRHPDSPARGHRSWELLEGATPDLRYMESHYSVLPPGASPHRPHSHEQEEILIVMDGEAELTVERSAGCNRFRSIRARPGDFIYYPANWRHTLTNPGRHPVTYLMFKWLTDEIQAHRALQNVFIRGMSRNRRPRAAQRSGMGMTILLEGQTRFLRKLHAHRTVIAPGRGYAAHADAHDVAIVLIEGRVETLGREVNAPALVYYAAGEVHGLTNIGDREADYIVFEFHGKHGEACVPLSGKIAKAIRDPGLVLRFAREKAAQLFGI